jgi:hypothetical protein
MSGKILWMDRAPAITGINSSLGPDCGTYRSAHGPQARNPARVFPFMLPESHSL